jgi:putative DNA primase/helicase
MLSAEDSTKDVIRPRLEAAGADLDRVYIIEAAKDGDGRERTFDLQHDIDKLRKIVADFGDVALVVIDPITSYMGSKIDSHRTTDVRAVLEPLARFAEETGVAVLAVTHPPKAAQGKAINSFTGSLAFVAAVRLAFIVAEEAETNRRLMLSVKNNLGAQAPGLGYQFEQRLVGKKNIVASCIAWDGAPVTMTADQAINQSRVDTDRMTDAKEFLLEYLAQGPMSVEQVKEAAKAQDISDKVLRRAREKLGVVTKRSGFSKGATWELPKTDNVVAFPARRLNGAAPEQGTIDAR